MSDVTRKTLQSKLETYHGIFHHNKCEGNEIEEIFHDALDMDPKYAGKLEWTPNSHNPGTDITFLGNPPEDFSIKSGKFSSKKRNVLTVSGNRLTRAEGDLNDINALLKSYTSKCMICFVCDKADGFKYQIIYVDSDKFIYPDTAKAWTAEVSKKSGKISSYVWTAPNGMKMKLTPAMSWQIWWGIPTNLCRFGPLFDPK